ncbi:MAG TPA: pyridoxal-phosphate dependent enzyme [Chloroflexi bacterium]|nr:pyridoxal-phosphate dependent enzyme [Chloroflexota bacterium]
MSIPWRCASCGTPYPDDALPYRCPKCGDIFDRVEAPRFAPEAVDNALPGIWRYRHTFALPPETPPVSLGEGRTPLVWDEAFGRRVAFKLEFINPTGSHKDRGAALMAAFLKSRGVTTAVEDSSGNAGAAFAAYAARAGIHARIYTPAYASPVKRAQMAAYGAEVVAVDGPRSAAAEAARQDADRGIPYASHAFLPVGLDGYATIAYEIYEQMGAPASVVAPVGHGGLLLGIARGFLALLAGGVIEKMPRLFGVQALACAPVWAVARGGREALGWVTDQLPTVAEGVRVRWPVWGDKLLNTIEGHDGTFLVVEEEAILPGREELARRGFFVEPTSAIVWDALRQIANCAPDPIAVVLTGSGFKAPQVTPVSEGEKEQ